MGRTLQIICGGVLALTLVGAAPSPSERAQAEQTKATQDLAEAAQALARSVAEQAEPAEPPLLERPCEPGQDHRDSDLCAQWKAADAAREAARWSFWSTLVGVVGVIGLVLNFAQGRAALKKARDANKIAQDTAEGQLRPYVFSGDLELDDGRWRETGEFVFHYRWKNFGQTPARDARSRTFTKYLPYGPYRLEDMVTELPSHPFGHTIAPGNHEVAATNPIDEQAIRDVASNRFRMMILCEATYRGFASKRQYRSREVFEAQLIVIPATPPNHGFKLGYTFRCVPEFSLIE